MFTRCPKCGQALEDKLDDEPKDTLPGYLPTRLYKWCARCCTPYPPYSCQDEGEP